MDHELPKSIQVGPTLWEIREIDLDDECEWGNIKHNTCIISIASDTDLQVQQSTLLHEVLHAIWFTVGLPHTYEEKVISAMEALLLDTIKRNPELMIYLSQSKHLGGLEVVDSARKTAN